MLQHRHAGLATLAVVAALGAYAVAPVLAQQPTPAPTPPQAAPGCPTFGWEEGLGKNFQVIGSQFPIHDTANDDPQHGHGTPDCIFHQWSVEAFVWATTLLPVSKGRVPRFMLMPTEEDLLSSAKDAGTVHARTLQLAARSIVAEGLPGFTEGAGAFVQADGNVMVAPNGYPVYTSVHMNPAYFATAQANLVATGAYQKAQADNPFPVGAAVFKATWLRLAPGVDPPLGAYVTEAQVPVLTVVRTSSSITIQPVQNKFVTARVALVGLHVVGVTDNHPEFLWGTFEHNLNAPQVADNTFSTSGSDPNNYTFYKANTSFGGANIAFKPPLLPFDTTKQTFGRVTTAVQENQTGGENNMPYGPGNVLAVGGQGQRFFLNEKKADAQQAIFASYHLVGTVWMEANTYNDNSSSSDALGSVNLANSTAETFEQYPNNADLTKVQNCFMCHNPSAISFQSSDYKPRLVAISHALAVGSEFAVPNSISGNVNRPLFKKP
jgi:hypothetical protein